MSITKAEMVEALREASKLGYLGGSGGGGGGSGGSGASSGADWSKKFTGAADAAKDLGGAALGAGSKIAEGGARMHDATDALSKGFAGLGAGSGAFGAALAKGTQGLAALGQNIDQNVDTWRKLSDTGLAFGNDIMAMKDQASAARMSIAEMSEVMQKNNSSMLGFGATSADSAKKLSKMSNEFFTSGLGEQLRGMGYTTKELNDVLAVSISGSKLKDLKDKDGQDRSLKAAASLATEMDAVAKITGQSKQEQLDELRRKATDGQRMAAIDEAIAKGGVGAKEAFDAISANGKLMGPQFQKLAEDMASMGRPSEGMEAAYGLLSSDAKKLMNEAGEAARSGDRERAAMLTKQAAAEQAAFQNTSQYRTMAAQAGIKETQESYAQGAKFRNALADAGGNINNVEESMKKLDDQVKKEQQAGGKDDPNASAGASITRFAVDVESRGRDLTKALNDQVIQPLVKDIGPRIKDAGKAMGITAQKGDVSKEDQKTIDAEKDPAKKAALQSAAEDKKAATLIDRNLAEPMKAGYDKARINRDVKTEAGPGGSAGQDGAGSSTSPLHKDVVEFNRLITGNQKQQDATLKVLERLAVEQTKATGKPVTANEVAVSATNKPGGMAEIVKEIKKELGDSGGATVVDPNKGSGKTRLPGKEDKPIEALGKGVEALGGLFTTTPGKVFVTGVEAAAGGGIVDKPSLKLVGEAGPEAIFNQSQLENYTAKVMGSAASAMPKMDTSKLEMPKLEMPKLEMPKMGKEFEVLSSQMTNMSKPVEMPKLEMPDMSKDMSSLAAELSKMGKLNSEAYSKLDLNNISKTISTSISSVTGGKESTVKSPDMREMSNSMAKMGMKDDQKKVFDEMMTLTDQQSKEKLASLKEETAAAYAANKASSAAIDAMEDKLEAEGRHIKDLTAEERKKYDELRTQQNESYDNINKSIAATKAAEHAEKQKQSLQKLGYDVVVKQEEDKVKIVEDNSEKIKSDISDALPVKEVAAKQEEFKSQFSESQQKIIDDYKGYSEENRSFHAQAMEAGVKEDTETAQMIGARISKMKAEIGDRQATEEEQKALENEEANKKMFEQQVEKKKEMLDVMQNLGDYSAKRELELKQKAIDDAISIDDKKTDTIKSDIADALPVEVDNEFGDLDGAIAKNKAEDDQAAKQKQLERQILQANGVDIDAMEAEAEKERQAAWDSAVPDKLDAEPMPPKKSMGDMMSGMDFSPTGMPIMKSVDAAKKSITAPKPADPEAAKTAAAAKAKEEAKKTDSTEKKSDSKSATKESTLSDVVSALNTLNKQMGQLIAVSEEGHKSTTKATKSTAGNIYAR